MAKTLIYDIETSPNITYTFGQWQQNIPYHNVKEPSFMLCWSAKWLDSDEIYFERISSRDMKKGNDKIVSQKLWKLLDEADITVAHNGDKFDNKVVNTRFIENDLGIPSPSHSVDTLKVAKRHFKFPYNSLAYLCETLDLPRKLDHKKFSGISLWKECLSDNPEAWDEMREYNIQDIISLEALYLKLRPYMNNHPYTHDEECCPRCQSDRLQKRGFYTTRTGLQYQRYYCNDCRSWSASRTKRETTRNNIRSV